MSAPPSSGPERSGYTGTLSGKLLEFYAPAPNCRCVVNLTPEQMAEWEKSLEHGDTP